MNVPRTIGAVITSKHATLHELNTVYGMEDLYDLLEIISIDAHNQRVMQEKSEK